MKRLKFLFLMLIFTLVFVGCAASPGRNTDSKNDGNYGGGEVTENDDPVDTTNNLPNRKIIYTVRAHISTNDSKKALSSIKKNLKSDEWLDNEVITSNRIELTIRVKSSRLDEFVENFSNYGEVGNFSKIAEDISVKYQDHTIRIQALEAELARLQVLYNNASVNEMISLNRRITEVSAQLNSLNSELNKFDSLVDYSVVYLTIYEHKIEKEPSFTSAVGKAFIGGWNATVNTLKYFVIVLSALIPFSIILIPVGATTYFIVKRKKK